MDEQEHLTRVKAAKIVLERAKVQYLEELSSAHQAGIGYRKLAAALDTDPPAVMRYLKRNT